MPRIPSFSRQSLLGAVLILSSFQLCGCRQLWPDVSRPGTAPDQQRRATFHDPYPDPDLAPEIVGGRPREFQVPYHEPVKSRTFVDRFQ